MKGSSIALVPVFLGLSWVQMTAPVFASTGQQRARHAASKTSRVTQAHPTRVNFAGVPLTFEKNVGQLDGNIKFLARAEGYSLFLTTTGAIMSFRVPLPAPVMQSHRTLLRPQARNVRWKYGSRRVEMQFVAANTNSRVSPGEQLPAKSNYFISRDPTRWWSGVPNYSTVEYRDLYPGVDLVYRSVQSELEYDFIVQPGHNPRSIALTFRRAAGVKIDPNGNLVVRASGGELKLHKPVAYQEYADGKHMVAAHYLLTDTGQASSRWGCTTAADHL